ncbi:protein odr-4 homolog [Anabrus simplex]|uniref:protein odr-4 homolog n=1 Tax=Anabrus simplex TaxID=316456 RepID=UPI0035A3874B
MVRSVVAEENILPYLTRLTRQEGYDIGLILGQTTENRDYVVHLARTPRTSSKGTKDDTSDSIESQTSIVEPSPIKSISDIQESCVADHAKHVTRMLPGGMFVLGIFVVGPGDVFATDGSVARLCTILARIKKTLSSSRFLYGNSPSSEKLVLHLSSKTHRFVCKMLNPDSAHSTPITIDWKFQPKATKWHQIDCQYELDQQFPIPIDKVTQPLKKILQDVLTNVSEQIKLAVCMIDGEVRESSEIIETIGRKKKGKNSSKPVPQEEGKLLSASMYIPCDKQVDKETEMLVQECCGEMKFQGILASRVFLHQKASVQEAVQALKEDIVRSLASRLEMHWDSLIEEEQGSPEEHVTLHEPPRRVLVPLPHCRVSLSDYLFPGEGPSEALISLQELLDLRVNESDVQKELEMQADPSEYYSSDIQIENDASEDLLPVSMSKSTVVLIALTIAVAILAVSIALQFSGWRDSK